MNFLQRLFSQPKSDTEEDLATHVEHSTPDVEKSSSDQVQPMPAEEHETERKFNALSPGLNVGKLSDVGRERERNEDSIFVAHSFLQHDLGTEPFGLFIVADGMGGHQRGEVASSLAVRMAADSILKDVYAPYLTNDNSANNRPINEALTVAVEQANTAVVETVPDGGTTIIVALIMGNNAYIAHVGDSRAYIFQPDKFKQITQDHSLAQKLEQLGQSAEEAMQAQSVLYRAVGQGDSIEVDTHMQHLPPGASLLLCTDGLWGLVNDKDINLVLRTAATPQNACTQLIAMANDNGGRDNISAIVVSMGAEG